MSNAAAAQKRYTWTEYRTWPDDERWEIVGGDAYAMSPSPTARHQAVQLALSAGLHAFFRGTACRVYPAPLDVKLSETDIVQPDVLVVCRPGQIKPTHIEGAPALVVEILSESSVQRDRGVKMRLYAAHGVAEVWLVTPAPALVEVYRLDGEGYRLSGAYTDADVLKSPGFPKLKLRLKDVFEFPLELDEQPAVVRESPSAYGAKPGAVGGRRPAGSGKGEGARGKPADRRLQAQGNRLQTTGRRPNRISKAGRNARKES